MQGAQEEADFLVRSCTPPKTQTATTRRGGWGLEVPPPPGPRFPAGPKEGGLT